MKYKIIIGTSPGWVGKPVIAQLKTKVDYLELSRAIWKPDKLDSISTLEFSINQTVFIPDLIISGVFWLLSNRFLWILRDFKVVYESFPVVLSGKKATLTNYQLFHLLQVRQIVDVQKSIIHNPENIERIALLEMIEIPELCMIRDTFLMSRVFVREDLIQRIQEEGITGCDWMEPSEYSFSVGKKKW